MNTRSLVLLALVACETQGPPPSPSAQQPVLDVTSLPSGQPVIAELTDPPRVPHGTYRDRPARVRVELEVKEIEKEIAPGVRYTMWTFGGSVPGKFIRVRQGDIVELTLQNHPSSKLPHNIDLHAVTGPGGGAEATFTAPGKQTTFTFRALNPGLYVYHCATAPVPMHVANGMYGLIFVEPAQQLPFAHHEFYVMQGEVYTTGKYHETGLQAFDIDKGIDERPTYVLFNGAEGAVKLKARAGEKIRIFVGNGGPNLVSSFHVIGEIFDRVYAEGGTTVQENVQTTLVPAGGAVIVELTVEVPGKYILVDHSLFRAFNKGAVGILEVEGAATTETFATNHADAPYVPRAPVVAVAAPPPPPEPVTGEGVYKRVCAACHQPDGRGVPGSFPPLAASDYIAGATTDKLVDHVVNGLTGPITVNGASYNGVMPPMGFLTDAEIAAALTFVGKSWGNNAPTVTAGEVARMRKAK